MGGRSTKRASIVPVLDNPRHEKFAQELAKGKSAGEAYRLAGYDADDKSAETAGPRLFKNVQVKARVAELQAKAAVKAELTAQSVIDNLVRIAVKAEQIGESSGLNVARGAWMDAAKVSGFIVEKKEVGKAGDFKRMTEDELDAYIAAGQGAFGRSDSGEGPQAGEAGVRGKPSGIH